MIKKLCPNSGTASFRGCISRAIVSIVQQRDWAHSQGSLKYTGYFHHRATEASIGGSFQTNLSQGPFAIWWQTVCGGDETKMFYIFKYQYQAST